MMEESIIDNRWVRDEKKVNPFSFTGYTPESLDRFSEGSGLQGCLVENLFTNCGSGSWCEASFQGLKRNITHHNVSGAWTVVVLPISNQSGIINPATTADKLNEIRDSFGLSMASLADVLRASRASLYNWFDSEPRSEDILQRIELVYEFAQKWKTKNLFHYAPGKLMKQKLANGPSMLERLSREKLDLDEIEAGLDHLLTLMTKQRERMDRAKARSARAPLDSESQDEVLERFTGSVTSET